MYKRELFTETQPNFLLVVPKNASSPNDYTLTCNVWGPWLISGQYMVKLAIVICYGRWLERSALLEQLLPSSLAFNFRLSEHTLVEHPRGNYAGIKGAIL